MIKYVYDHKLKIHPKVWMRSIENEKRIQRSKSLTTLVLMTQNSSWYKHTQQILGYDVIAFSHL